MNEQFPGSTPPEQPQFDADAAQKAKEFLEEGVTRRGYLMADGTGNISNKPVDKNGESIAGHAVGFVDSAKRADEEIKSLEESKRELTVRAQTVNEIRNTLQGSTPEQTSQLNEKARALSMGVRNTLDEIDSEKNKRDANLWRGRQHYLENQEGYVAQAVGDANAAGHDVKIGGHEFPRTDLDQQPTQSVEPQEPQLQ